MNTNIISLLKNINISKIMSYSNKTLGVLKKSIPVYKELRPYIRKEKSIFNKSNDEIDNIKISKSSSSIKNRTQSDSLTFFQ